MPASARNLTTARHVATADGLARTMISERGDGAVVVIDGAGATDPALFRYDMAALAHDNAWAGVVVNGAADVPVTIAGQTIRPGAHLWADRDGIVVER